MRFPLKPTKVVILDPKEEATLRHPLDALARTLLTSLSPICYVDRAAGVQVALRTEIYPMACFWDFAIFN